MKIYKKIILNKKILIFKNTILTTFLNNATTSLGTSNFDAVLGATSRLKSIFLLLDVSLPVLNSTIQSKNHKILKNTTSQSKSQLSHKLLGIKNKKGGENKSITKRILCFSLCSWR